MKKIVCFFLIPFIFLLSLSLSGLSQKKKTKESRAARKERLKQEDKLKYQQVLLAFENNLWAFETPQLVDNFGSPIDGQHQPNVVGFNSRDMAALIVYRIESRSMYDKERGFTYQPVTYEGPVIKQERKTDKKGRIIYKYQVAMPFRAEVTVTLFPDTPYGTVNISNDRSPVQFNGRFMPIQECWYYLKSDR